MKKLLLASAAVAVLGGAAHADVSLSGDAFMGVSSVEGADYSFTNRARVRFSLSAESDSGLKFGAQFRAADAEKAGLGTSGTVFLDIPKVGKLTMGDADGAVQAAVTQFVAIGHDETKKLQEFTFLTGGSVGKGTDLLYSYTNGSLVGHLSMGSPGTGSGSGATAGSDDRAVGLSYTTEFWKVAVGYEDNGPLSQTVISGSVGNGQIEVKAAYGQRSDDKSQYVVYGTYIVGTTTFTVFTRDDEYKNVEANGLGVTHDLGGGMALSAGYAKQKGKDSNVSLGATFSF